MTTKDGGTRIYTVPAEEVAATDYRVSVDGRPVFTHAARVSAFPVNEYCPDHQRPLEQTEIASFASWDQAAPVAIEIVSRIPVDAVRVRPSAAAIVPEVAGDTIRFALERPGQYTVEINGVHRALHLFANPPETAIPDANAPDVLYFGPGVHCAGLIRMRSGQTVYLAAGAVVYGAILAEHVRDAVIAGRGILDGSKFAREDLTGLVTLYDCENIRMDGITLRDAGVFTVMPMNCRELHMRNIKIVGNWRYNSDGVDFANCAHCSVEDSFIRTFDDSICVKGYASFGPFLYHLRMAGNVMDDRFTAYGQAGTFAALQDRFGLYPSGAAACRDIRVRRCVIWCDWGRPLELGAETVAEEMSDLLFEDCDLIHTPLVAMSIQNCDRARCRNIVYRDIRVEMDDQPFRPVITKVREPPDDAARGGFLPGLIKLANQVGYVTYDAVRGHIEDILFENIAVTAPSMPRSSLIGYDAEHLVQRVLVKNLRLNGQPVEDLAGGGFTMNEFVRDIVVEK
jgi:hypothetical protein